MDNLQKDFKGEEVVSLPEAADQLGIARSSFNRWINNHQEIKEEYCFKTNYKGGRRRIVIKLIALPIIANMKDIGGRRKSASTAQIQKGKKKIAKIAIEKGSTEKKMEWLYKTVCELRNDVLELKHSKQPKQIEKKNPLALPMAKEEPPPISHRAMINQRLRKFAQENEFEYFVPWGRLYEEIYYRYSINVRAKAKARNLKPIDYLAEKEMLEATWVMACSLFKLKGE